jgi:NADH:ubiquinone oxidoreductase subunit D
LLTGNRIWRERLLQVGVLEEIECTSLGLTGVLLISTGLGWYLRKVSPYDNYENFFFKIPVGLTGDCFERYNLRTEEMRQSGNIMQQNLQSLPVGAIKVDSRNVSTASRTFMKLSMEALIQHFKFFTNGYKVDYRWECKTCAGKNKSARVF